MLLCIIYTLGIFGGGGGQPFVSVLVGSSYLEARKKQECICSERGGALHRRRRGFCQTVHEAVREDHGVRKGLLSSAV